MVAVVVLRHVIIFVCHPCDIVWCTDIISGSLSLSHTHPFSLTQTHIYTHSHLISSGCVHGWTNNIFRFALLYTCISNTMMIIIITVKYNDTKFPAHKSDPKQKLNLEQFCQFAHAISLLLILSSYFSCSRVKKKKTRRQNPNGAHVK